MYVLLIIEFFMLYTYIGFKMLRPKIANAHKYDTAKSKIIMYHTTLGR